MIRSTLILASGLALTLGLGSLCQAAVILDKDFSTDPNIGAATSSLNKNVGSPGSWDSVNEEVDYAHTAGTTRRLLNYNASSPFTFASTQGYMKAEVINFSGSPSIWIGFVEDNDANNANYVQGIVSGNGTYELVVNNSSASIGFDNGAGWSGTLGAQEGLLTTDGGTSTSSLTFGGSVDSNVTLKGFGFANFGNSTVFPSSAFSVDSLFVSDSATLATAVPEPTIVTLAALGLGGLALRRWERGLG